MLQSILSHTPGYVWVILGFLLYRGITASATRERDFKNVFIIPVLMLGLSLQGIDHSVGLHSMAPWFWLGGAAIATSLVLKFSDARAVTAHPQRGSITVRASWLPLAMMLAVFVCKYVVAVSLATHPQYSSATGFMVIVCAAYGLVNGVFIGKLLLAARAYHLAGDKLALA